MANVENLYDVKISRVDLNTAAPNLFDLKPPNYNSQIETADSQGDQRGREQEYEKHVDRHRF